MSCLDEDAIAALLGGRLDVDGLKSVEAHMDTCAECRKLVSTLAAENDPEAEGAAAPAVSDIGSVVDGRFRLEAVAGRGGMGRVYRARDLRNDATVALKRVDVDDARFTREARVLADLEHPAIVRHLADGTDVDGSRYLAMEWLEGEDLAQRLEREKRLSVADTLVLAKRVAAALAAAHDRGVVHRDVKPSNLFLPAGRIDEVKIVDFGLARAPMKSSVRTRAGTLLGTLGYMAPEQARGDEDIGPAADVFALGCVLYECLTGERAFAGPHAVAVLARLLTGKPPRPRAHSADVPRALDALVARMLARDPADRPANGAGVVSELAALGSLRALMKPTKRRWIIVSAALAVFALFVVLAGSRVGARHGGSAAAAPDASGESAAPRAITDFRPLEGVAPAVATEYEAGLDAIRKAELTNAKNHLLRAVEIDKTFSPAHLRLALWTDTVMTAAEGRAHYQAARASKERLDLRDKELLEAVEPAFLLEPPDMDEAQRRLRALAQRRSGDAELALLGVGVSNGKSAPADYDEVLAIDPRFAYAWWSRANAQFRTNDNTAARTSIDRCLDAAPSATLCVLLRTRIDAREGRCEEMERDARRVIALENGGDNGYAHLANALAAQAADRVAVEDTVRARASATAEVTARQKIERNDLAQVAIAFGDFVDAERHARALDELVKDEPFVQDHVRATVLLVDVLEERGDALGAAKVADAFLRRRAAWRSVAKRPNDEPVPLLLSVASRGGLRTAGEIMRERTAWIDEWRTKLGKRGEEEIWIQAWARPARTARDIDIAAASMPEEMKAKTIVPSPPGWITPQGLANAHAGRVQVAAGHAREAIETLGAATRHCSVLSDASTHRRALFWLGLAYEAAADTAGACNAYGALVERWGSARPRSVTAAAASERQSALRCPSKGR